MAWGFVGAAICLTPIAASDPALSLSLVHCLLFLGSAALYWDYAGKTSTGVFVAVAGLALWGFVYPIDINYQPQFPPILTILSASLGSDIH